VRVRRPSRSPPPKRNYRKVRVKLQSNEIRMVMLCQRRNSALMVAARPVGSSQSCGAGRECLSDSVGVTFSGLVFVLVSFWDEDEDTTRMRALSTEH